MGGQLPLTSLRSPEGTEVNSLGREPQVPDKYKDLAPKERKTLPINTRDSVAPSELNI